MRGPGARGGQRARPAGKQGRAAGRVGGEVRDPTTLERVAEVLTDYEAQRRGRAVAIRLLD
ncbi:MAG TPA: hypothetical protein VGC13_20060 [Longimicrobium sp.]|uniref:hypothetical protein n=1 Tax=Longimicrobium sp. TaxID=2029185 RepID=UPI002EDAF5A3